MRWFKRFWLVVLDVFVLTKMVFGSQKHNKNRNLSQCKRHCEGDSPKQSLGLGCFLEFTLRESYVRAMVISYCVYYILEISPSIQCDTADFWLAYAASNEICRNSQNKDKLAKITK